MPTVNHNTSSILAAGVGHKVTSCFFTTNGGGAVLTFGGPNVLSITQAGAGTYTVVLSPFVPDALISASPRVLAQRRLRVGAVVIDPAARTTTLTLYSSPLSAGPSNSAVSARVLFRWKMFFGIDRSGL